MIINRLIDNNKDKLSFRKVESNIFKVSYPCYHEDGDMYDVFLRINNNGGLELCDMGATLMRLSYSFELNTDTRIEILRNILQSNCIENNDGNLYVATTEGDFLQNLLSFSLAMSKIVNMNILKRENIYSLFIEQVRDYISEHVQSSYQVEHDVIPTKSLPYKISYVIKKLDRPPVYLSTINSTLQAVRTAAVYSQLRQSTFQYFSVAVHENFDNLASVDRNAITNATDKQYTSYHDFRDDFEGFLKSKIA